MNSHDTFIQWMPQTTFYDQLDKRQHSVSPFCVDGKLADASTRNLPLGEKIDDEPYLFDAWRHCGVIGVDWFELDIFENDLHGKKPLGFLVTASRPGQIENRSTDERLLAISLLLTLLSPIQIHAIATTFDPRRYSIKRDSNVVFASDSMNEVGDVLAVLRSKFGQDNLELHST